MPGGLQLLLERGENLGADAHRIRDRGRADRLNHEFLDVDGVVGMLAAIDDVHHRHRQGAGRNAADIAIQRHAIIGGGGLGQGQRHAEDGIRAQARFIGCAVQVDEDIVDADLILGIQPGQRVEYLALNRFDGRSTPLPL